MQADRNLNAYIEDYAGLEGRDLIASVARDFGPRAAVLSSFGAESAVLLHMVSEVAPGLAVVFLDTGKLFPETLAYRDQLLRQFGLSNLITLAPSEDDLLAHDPAGDLHKIDTDLCCEIRKTAPLNTLLKGYDAVISGRKRFHGASRSALDFVSVQDGRLKVEPLASFTALDLSSYAERHHLPEHPLRAAGYRSIGCVPCTVPGGSDDNPRAGRWSGSEKTECGIHFTANGTIVRQVSRGAVLADAVK